MSITEQILIKCAAYELIYNRELEHIGLIYTQMNNIVIKKSERKGKKCEMDPGVAEELASGKIYLEKIAPLKEEILILSRELVSQNCDDIAIAMMKSGPSGILIGLRRLEKSNNKEQSDSATKVLSLLFNQ